MALATLIWKGRADQYVNTLIRVAPRCREYRRKKGHVERERRVRKAAAHTSQGESRVASRQERLVSAKIKREARSPIECVVQLDGIEFRCIVAEEVSRLHPFGIERADPALCREGACAEQDFVG